MTLFDEYIDEIIEKEGGYSNDPDDSGGETICGVTKDVAIEYGYTADLKSMPMRMIKQIYKEQYWYALRLDNIETTCPSIVKELLDTGINQGVDRASRYLQVSLNALNREEADYPDLKVDGIIGMVTISALKTFVVRRGDQGELVLLRALNCLQGAFYIELSQAREKDERFVFGWLLNRVVI